MPDSQQLLRLLLDGVKDCAIYTLDAARNVTSWNAGAARIEGYSEAEILDAHFFSLPRIALLGSLYETCSSHWREGGLRKGTHPLSIGPGDAELMLQSFLDYAITRQLAVHRETPKSQVPTIRHNIKFLSELRSQGSLADLNPRGQQNERCLSRNLVLVRIRHKTGCSAEEKWAN